MKPFPFEVIIDLLKILLSYFLGVIKMNTIDEVRDIEKRAEELESSFNQKLSEMKDTADAKILAMKQDIDKDVDDYRKEQLEINTVKLEEIKGKLDRETIVEVDSLKEQYKSSKDKLVDIVIEEVMKQYGNS